MRICIPTHLTDAELTRALARLAGSSRGTTSRLVAHIAEFDARKLHLAGGFSSLFAYCCEVLHLSEPEAGNRIAAARAARRFPVVLDLLDDGSVNLTTVRLLAPHLTRENHRELLAAATQKSKRDVEELIARRFPRPDIAASIRRLPTPTMIATSLDGPPLPISIGRGVPSGSVALPPGSRSTGPETAGVPRVAATPPPRPAVIAPLAPTRYEIRFTASAETREKLQRAQEQLRHAIPTGDLAEIFDRALTALIADLARQKVAALRSSSKDRTPRATALGSRHVPARVKRAVWTRDGGQCAYVAHAGRRCAERGFLEFHHVRPHAVGGEPTNENIGLRCRAHNGYEADLFFGPMRGASGAREPPNDVSARLRCARASPA